jgi:hypothetical protein
MMLERGPVLKDLKQSAATLAKSTQRQTADGFLPSADSNCTGSEDVLFGAFPAVVCQLLLRQFVDLQSA